MYKNKKILAIVTARGGSKGLLGKNIRLLNGKPLIAWTLERAKCSCYLDRIYVSTDSQEIADVCSEWGVEVPELRPDSLAQDTSSSVDVLEYSISHLKNQGDVYDYLLLLEPTSPIRKIDDIDNIISIAVDHPEADGVISIGRVHLEHPSIIKKVNTNGYITPYVDGLKAASQRQLEDEAFFPYGVGYLIKTEILMKEHKIYTDKILPYYIDRWQNYEVDDIYDFICIEAVMKEVNI